MNRIKRGIFLIFLLCISYLVFLCSVINSQPALGEWIVTGDETVENTVFTLNGNLTIKDGGKLTLRNVILYVNSSFPDQYQIFAEANSSLYVYDSTILPTDTRYGPVMRTYGANFVMRNSSLQLGESPEGTCSFQIDYAQNCVVENNTITVKGAEDEAFRSTIALNQLENATIKDNYITSEQAREIRLSIDINDSNNTCICGNTIVIADFILSGCWNTSIANNTIGIKPALGGSCGLNLRTGCGNNIVNNNTFNAITITTPAGGPVCTAFRLINTPYPNAFTNNIIGGDTQSPDATFFQTPVFVSQASNAIIANNTFIELPNSVFEETPSLREWQHEAMQVFRSSNNQILNNFINSTNCGILLFASSNNTLKGNQISNSGRGLSLYYSSDNNVIENNTLDNNLVNIICDESNNNTIHTNNFVTSERNAHDDGNNYWAQNYWSDYVGQDKGNGVGAVPYYIPYKGVDNEPLTNNQLLLPVPVPTLEIANYERTIPESGSPPTTTIWDNMTIADQTIMLDQDITISSGASATLENVTLIAAPSNRTEWYWLTVSPNATLSINNSKVIGADKCPGISFKVQEEAKFVVTNSELRDLGDPTTIVGQFIELTGTNDALIANNVITGAHGVINLQGERASNVRIINNTISKSYFGIYIYDWENSAFTNNTISEVAQSSVHICFSTNCSIVGNTISDVWGFINWGSLTNTSFSNNRIINYNSGYIGHIDDSKVPINKALAASFTFTPSPSYANQPLAFDASPSTPGNGTITSYQWNLSDGATATGMTTTHSYTTSGNYSVTLNVTNSEGLWYTKTKIVTVQAPIPTPTPTPTPTSTPTPSPTPTATPAPTATPTPAPTATPTSQPTPTPTPTATPTLTESPSPTPATTAALPQEVIYVVAAAAITAIAVAVVILIRKQKK